MDYEKKPGEGRLFKNKKKASESDADYYGYYMHKDGVTEEGINAWINTSDKAETAAKGVAEAKKALAPQPQPEGFPEDDIPF